MKPGAIIPSNVASLKSLTVTMAVMSYLACLAIGALILVDRAVTSWTGGLAREMTVQVRVVRAVEIEREVEKATLILSSFPGIAGVQVLDADAGAKLLEPWLGTRSLEGLPVPRLIRVVADENAPPDIEALERPFRRFSGVSLDTHRKWEAELTRMARALSILSYAILASSRSRRLPSSSLRQGPFFRPTAPSSISCISSAQETATSRARLTAGSCRRDCSPVRSAWSWDC
jgi:cell division transport system permease protein